MSKTTSSASAAVNTKNVPQRRILHFESLDQVLSEVDRIVAAEKAGRLKRLGNWKVGQTLSHLAAWAEYSYTGAPLNVPFFIRWFAKMRKQKFLYGPMNPGLRIPGLKDGTLATEDMPLDQAHERLRRAFERLQREAPTLPSKLLGPLTHEEWIAINLRHSELHLGFLIPE